MAVLDLDVELLVSKYSFGLIVFSLEFLGSDSIVHPDIGC